jgi:hypothetical protein
MVDRRHLPDPSKDDAVDRPRPPVERRRCVLGENSTSADKRAIDATCTPAFRRRQLNARHMQAASVTWCRWLGVVSSITGGAAIGISRGFLPYRGSARLPRTGANWRPLPCCNPRGSRPGPPLRRRNTAAKAPGNRLAGIVHQAAARSPARKRHASAAPRSSTVARNPNGSGVTPRIHSHMRSTLTSTKIAFARSESLGK